MLLDALNVVTQWSAPSSAWRKTGEMATTTDAM
jgi:hypothetical protein